jgi:Mg-chelatase subunit ChlD
MQEPSFSGRIERKVAERGSALLLMTLMLAMVVLPLVGLSIDGGIVYFAHARLVAAVDAAALAGARSLNVGLEFSDQKANAELTAMNYFNANFPAGMLNTTLNAKNPPQALASESADHLRTVQVQGSLDVGLYFLRLLGSQTATISASASSSRRDVNLVLALDRSGSMVGVCETMKSDAEAFVANWTNGRDTVGLVTFMGNAGVDYPSTKFFKSQTPSLTDILKTLECGNETGSAQALSLAHQQIMSVAEPGALNVIVFFTDGEPNGYTAGPATSGAAPGFPVITGKTCNGGKPVAGYVARGGGIYAPAPQPISSTAAPLLPGCEAGSFNTLAQTFAYIPQQDAYGNSAFGYAFVPTDGQGQITFSNFSDQNSDAISKNAADDAALKIRQDGIFVLTIGLDGDGGVDGTLLKRLANDPGSPIYSSTQPVGKYYYSPNAGQLGSIFNSIAAEILRISR